MRRHIRKMPLPTFVAAAFAMGCCTAAVSGGGADMKDAIRQSERQRPAEEGQPLIDAARAAIDDLA
jgi:hypothetical protein